MFYSIRLSNSSLSNSTKGNVPLFPDYIDYLPKGAIARKVKVMGYMPKKEVSQYPYIGMSKEEYNCFVKTATQLVVNAIENYRRINKTVHK